MSYLPNVSTAKCLKKFRLLRLVKNGSSSCESCGHCAKVCPMDIIEIQKTQEKPTNITYSDCTLCGQCVEFCPEDDVMQLKYTKIPLFKSSKEYFKKRNKEHKSYERNTWVKGSK